jgi:hypothetical protein
MGITALEDALPEKSFMREAPPSFTTMPASNAPGVRPAGHPLPPTLEACPAEPTECYCRP